MGERGIGRAEGLPEPGGGLGPGEARQGHGDLELEARVLASHQGREAPGDLAIPRTRAEAVQGEHRVGEIGDRPDRLRADARVGIRLRDPEQRPSGLAARASDRPDRVQPAADLDPLPAGQEIRDRRRSPLRQRSLRLDSREEALRIQASARLPLVSLVHDAVDAPPPPLRPLAVPPVGHEEGAVAVDDRIRGLEPVGIARSARRELDLPHRREARAGPLAAVAHERAPPFAEEEIAAVRGRKRRLQVGDAPGGGAPAEIGERRKGLAGMLLVEVGIAVVRAEEAVVGADHVGAAVVLVVADEDVQLVVQGDVVDVSQAARVDVEVRAIGPAAEDAAALEHQPVPLGALHVAPAIAQRQVEPPVVAHHNSVRAVEPIGRLLRLPAQPPEEIAPLVGDGVPVDVPERREERRVHGVDEALVIGEPLDRVETGREDRRAVGIAVAVRVLDEAHLVAPDDLRAQAGHVVVREVHRTGPRPQGEARGVLDQRVAGEERGLEARLELERREALLGGGARRGRARRAGRAGRSPLRILSGAKNEARGQQAVVHPTSLPWCSRVQTVCGL